MIRYSLDYESDKISFEPGQIVKSGYCFFMMNAIPVHDFSLPEG